MVSAVQAHESAISLPYRLLPYEVHLTLEVLTDNMCSGCRRSALLQPPALLGLQPGQRLDAHPAEHMGMLLSSRHLHGAC